MMAVGKIGVLGLGRWWRFDAGQRVFVVGFRFHVFVVVFRRLLVVLPVVGIRRRSRDHSVVIERNLYTQPSRQFSHNILQTA